MADMKALAFAALIAAPAMAGELPLTAVYGTPDSCELFAIGGPNAVFSTGGTVGKAREVGPGYLLVSRTDIVGIEYGCHPETADGNRTTLSCSGEGAEWTINASISVEGDTLTYTDEDGTLELHPCPTDENAIM